MFSWVGIHYSKQDVQERVFYQLPISGCDGTIRLALADDCPGETLLYYLTERLGRFTWVGKSVLHRRTGRMGYFNFGYLRAFGRLEWSV